MRSLLFTSLLFLAASAQAQVIHIESEDFSAAAPTCTAPSCIQLTADTAPPAVGNHKIILGAGASFDYALHIVTGGQYSLTVRLNGAETVHFEVAGTDVSGPITNSNSLATFTAPKVLTLDTSVKSIRMVVDSVGAGYPSANWFELTYLAPPGSIQLNVTLAWNNGSPVTGTVRVRQFQFGAMATIGTFQLDTTGNLKGAVVVDSLQPDPIEIAFELSDTSGNIIGTIDQHFSPQMFLNVSKVVASITLSQKTMLPTGISWASQ